MFQTLRNKILWLNLTLISLVMLVAFIAIFTSTLSNLTTENEKKLHQLMQSPVFIINGETTPTSPDQLTHTRFQIPKNALDSFRLFFDDNGNLVSISSFLENIDYQQAISLISTSSTSGTIQFAQRTWRYQVSTTSNNAVLTKSALVQSSFPAGSATQIAFLDISESVTVAEELLINLILIGFMMLFVIFAISSLFAQIAIKPVEAAFIKQQQFIADASHELKTPLAIIRTNTDVLLTNQTQSIASQRKWLDYIQDQTHRMSSLVSELLYLAENDATTTQLNLQSQNISHVIASVIAQIEVFSFEKGLHLHTTLPPDVIATVDSDKFKQVLVILLDNALKYTERGGHIQVNLTSTKHSVNIQITNSFEQLDSAQLTQLFDRFYRANTARTYDGGHGLGLSIAQSIVQQHHGELKATSSSAGLTMSMKLPK